LAANYLELLPDQGNIVIPKITPNGIHSWQSFCVFVPKRNQIIRKLKEKNIETQIGTYALHQHKAFKENANCRIVGEMSGSRYAFDHCLTLPLYHELSEEGQEYIVDQLLQLLD
jgi:dTDP-4-amino-4,6-dideoxygalactose transaminase